MCSCSGNWSQQLPGARCSLSRAGTRTLLESSEHPMLQPNPLRCCGSSGAAVLFITCIPERSQSSARANYSHRGRSGRLDAGNAPCQGSTCAFVLTHCLPALAFPKELSRWMGALPGCAHDHTKFHSRWELLGEAEVGGSGSPRKELGCRRATWESGGLCLMQATKSRKTKAMSWLE